MLEKNPTAFPHSSHDRREIFVRQNHVGCLLGIEGAEFDAGRGTQRQGRAGSDRSCRGSGPRAARGGRRRMCMSDAAQVLEVAPDGSEGPCGCESLCVRSRWPC
jgi:hypothetical protein